MMLVGPQAQAENTAPKGAPKVLRYAFPIAETGFDPAQVSDLYSTTVVSNIFESPLTFDYLARPMVMKPQTAEALPEVSADFKTFTVRIRPGIFFADDPAFKGLKRELTAADYAYSLKRHFDPRWKSPRYASLHSEKILGLEALRQAAVKSGKPFDYDTPVEGLQTPDRYTLRIRLAQPSPRFAYHLTHPGISGAVAREVVEAYADTIMAHPVGTGPFRLTSWRRSSQMVFERNPNFREAYYDEQPTAGNAEDAAIAARLKGRRLPLVDRVEVSIVEQDQPLWLAFLANDFDYVAVPYNYAESAVPSGRLAPHLARRDMRVHRMLRSDVVFTYFNMEDPVVGGYEPEKVALRRALGLAYDNAEEIVRLRKGLAIPAQGIVPPNTFGYEPSLKTEMSDHSLPRARALLDLFGYIDRDGDGWRDRPDGSPLLLEFHTQPDATNRQFNEQWKKHLNDLRVRVDFKFAQWPEQLKQARAGKLMLWGLGNSASTPDAEEFLDMAYGPQKGESNLVRFDLPAFNDTLAAMKQLPDGPERQALIHKAQLLLTAYMPFKVHVHRISMGLSQPWMLGFKPHPFISSFWRFVDIDNALKPAP